MKTFANNFLPFYVAAAPLPPSLSSCGAGGHVEQTQGPRTKQTTRRPRLRRPPQEIRRRHQHSRPARPHRRQDEAARRGDGRADVARCRRALRVHSHRRDERPRLRGSAAFFREAQRCPSRAPVHRHGTRRGIRSRFPPALGQGRVVRSERRPEQQRRRCDSNNC